MPLFYLKENSDRFQFYFQWSLTPFHGLSCPVWIHAYKSPQFQLPHCGFHYGPDLLDFFVSSQTSSLKDHCISFPLCLEVLCPLFPLLSSYGCSLVRDDILIASRLECRFLSYGPISVVGNFCFFICLQHAPQNSLEYKFHGDSALKFLLSSLSLQLLKKKWCSLHTLFAWMKTFFFNMVGPNKLR